MKKGISLLTAVLASVLTLSACGQQQTGEAETEEMQHLVVETTEETETETETETESGLAEGQMYSYYTGLPVDETVGTKRPFAVMINNIEEAMPPSGISNAEIVYEAQVESNITRLLAIFQDVDNVAKIGSIRSARHYYVDFVNDNDALYVHFGQSVYAQERFDSEGIVTISGLSGYGSSVFWRADDRPAPHNVYTSGQNLEAALGYTGLSREYPEGYTPRLTFNVEDTPLKEGTTAASQVNIPFECAPYFTYNTDDGLYYRFEYGAPHIDAENGQQLCYKNIIVQYVEEWTISDYGHQDMTLNGEGSGWFISDGQALPITWKRADNNDRTKYYDSTGSEIRLNPGKTFFEIVPNTSEVTFQ